MNYFEASLVELDNQRLDRPHFIVGCGHKHKTEALARKCGQSKWHPAIAWHGLQTVIERTKQRQVVAVHYL
jgi:hypothetical protein